MHYVSPLAYKTRCNARGYAPQPSKPSTHCQQFAPLFNSVTKFKAITYVSFIYRPLRGQCSVHKRTHTLVLNTAATASCVCQQNAYVWNIVQFAQRGKYVQTWHILSIKRWALTVTMTDCKVAKLKNSSYLVEMFHWILLSNYDVTTTVTVILVCDNCSDENLKWFQNLMVNYHFYKNIQYSIIMITHAFIP